MGVEWFGFSYAALVASGGIVGYVKAGSVPSLAAGLLFGGLAGLGTLSDVTRPKERLSFTELLHYPSDIRLNGAAGRACAMLLYSFKFG